MYTVHQALPNHQLAYSALSRSSGPYIKKYTTFVNNKLMIMILKGVMRDFSVEKTNRAPRLRINAMVDVTRDVMGAHPHNVKAEGCGCFSVAIVQFNNWFAIRVWFWSIQYQITDPVTITCTTHDQRDIKMHGKDWDGYIK